jgi:formylglycine-generating enzyme required for sulfatase activity
MLVFSAVCVLPQERSNGMVKVEGGSFVMGLGHEDFWDNPPHRVTLDTFYMAKYLVTAGEWKAFLEETRYAYDWDWQDPDMLPFREIVPTDDCPAQGLNWYYAVEYCNWLSVREGLEPCYTVQAAHGKGFFHSPRLSQYFGYKEEELPVVTWNKQANGYRLPTDAEWEYAARGGRLSKGYLYAGSDSPDEVALYGRDRSYPVGQMKPNELGLYDMTGNVRVWCWDWYDMDILWLPEKNPSVDSRSDIRKAEDISRNIQDNHKPGKVNRGMSWSATTHYFNQNFGNVYARLDYAANYISWIGIRLVRSRL